MGAEVRAEVGGELVENASVHNQAMALNEIIVGTRIKKPYAAHMPGRFHGCPRPAGRLTLEKNNK